MRVIPKDKVVSRFSPENKVNYEVEDEEASWMEVDNCYGEQTTGVSVKRPDINISIMDRTVDPINVKGARPGDTLCVEVLVIDPAPQGAVTTPVGLGVLGDQITESGTEIILVHDGFTYSSENIKLPLTPAIGAMGAAPRGKEIHCAVPEDHGANMDTKLVAVDSRVYFPTGA